MATELTDIALVKKYSRIDSSEDDDVLTLLIESAKLDLAGSGVPKPDETVPVDPRYRILVALHVVLYNENRDPSIKIEKLNFAYQNLLLKLKQY